MTPYGSKRDGKGHHRYCPPGCTRDHRQPKRGGETHPEVQRYLDMAAAKMGNRERPHGNTTTYRPLSPAALHAAGRAAAGRSAGRLTY